MARPAKNITDPKKRKTHEARLARRRAAHAERRTIEMASQAAEGQSDFAELVAAERARQESQQATNGRAGGALPPKNMAKARDDLAMAFDLMGGVPALVVWGRSNPTEFYRLWSKLIPRPVEQASDALPLEALLEKLASREEMSVRDAAVSVGEELLAEGRKQAEAEDLEASLRTIN